MSTEIALVPIAGLEILCAHHNSQVLIPMKKLAEDIGVGWEAQRQRIQTTEILAEGTLIIKVPSPSGGPQDTLCLPPKLAFIWLITLPTGKIRTPEVRARVDALQRESFDAAYTYWSVGAAHNPRKVNFGVTRREMLATLDRLTDRDDPDARAFLTTLHNQDRAAIGLPPICGQPRQPGLFDGHNG